MITRNIRLLKPYKTFEAGQIICIPCHTARQLVRRGEAEFYIYDPNQKSEVGKKVETKSKKISKKISKK